MKNNSLRFLTALLALLVFPALIFAAELVAPATGNVAADGILTWLIPVLVPLILAGIKKLIPVLPTWVIPILAPGLGLGIEYVNHFATGHAANVLLSVALGAAGVGLREVKEAIKPAPNGGWPTPQ